MGKQYSNRDIVALDQAGKYYTRHVFAMTSEDLHDKSDIAAELAWRDYRITELQKQLGQATGLLQEVVQVTSLSTPSLLIQELMLLGGRVKNMLTDYLSKN